jgi:CysZ protein
MLLIPGLNVLAPIIWLLFTSWMMSLEYIAYPMENHNVFFAMTRKRLKSKRSLSLGFGLAVMFCSMVPLINFLIMPAAVSGATALWLERFR